MTPAATIALAVKAWPGTLDAIATETGISRARLCTYLAGDPGKAGYAPPTDETALVVVRAVRTLLASALASLPD